jgi:hypothetical protein
MIAVLCLVLVAGCTSFSTAGRNESSGSASENNFKPKDGYVPDAETAKRIAEAVWIPIYGKELIEGERPFEATLAGGVWTVTGKSLPRDALGGVAEIEIRKDDGKILRVIHGQ